MNSQAYIPAVQCFQNIVKVIWQTNRAGAFIQEQIIPKGIIEVIFNFSEGAPIAARLGTRQYDLPRCFINGFNRSSIHLQLPEKQVFFGILFQPLAIHKIFKTPASAFSDIAVDLTLLNSGFNILWHQLGEVDDFNGRVKIVLNWLKQYFYELPPRDQLMNDYLYEGNRHQLSVKQLANELCYSPRHLARKLSVITGMNTEEFLLYKKYLHAVDLMQHSTLSLTAIAYQSQFADQSHFIKTFKHYTSLTPGEYLRNRGELKGHIFQDVR